MRLKSPQNVFNVSLIYLRCIRKFWDFGLIPVEFHRRSDVSFSKMLVYVANWLGNYFFSLVGSRTRGFYLLFVHILRIHPSVWLRTQVNKLLINRYSLYTWSDFKDPTVISLLQLWFIITFLTNEKIEGLVELILTRKTLDFGLIRRLEHGEVT